MTTTKKTVNQRISDREIDRRQNVVQGVENSETPVTVMVNYANVIGTMHAHNIIMTTSWFHQSPESTPPQGQGHSELSRVASDRQID